MVGGYDHTLKKFAWGVVKATKKSIKRGLVSLFAAGTLIAQPTLEHPVWTENHHDYVPAQDLKVGDTLLDGKGATLRLDSLAIKVDTTLTVYNFEVNNLHNYYVGTQEVLVHNDCIKVSLTRTLCEELEDLFTDKAKFIKFAQALHNYPNIQLKFKDGIYKADEIWKIISESRLYIEDVTKKPKLLAFGGVLKTETVFEDIQDVINKMVIVRPAKLDISKLKDALYNVDYYNTIRITYARAAKVMYEYADKTNFERVINALASDAYKNQKGADWVLRYLEIPNVKPTIESFEALVKEGAGKFTADIKLIGGKLIELKAWKMEYINAISSTSITPQLANYFKQTSNFKQIFDFQSMKYNVTTGTTLADIAAAKSAIKDQYKALFNKSGAFDALGGNLNPTNFPNAYLRKAGILDETLFLDAVNNVNPALHDKLFAFIDVLDKP